ncbi:MAG: hypothetical protein ACI8PB_003111 [Desulforhopalus sp.]|jgi:hypothetical protein
MVSGFMDQFHFLRWSADLFQALFCSIVPISVITLEGPSQPDNTVQSEKVNQRTKAADKTSNFSRLIRVGLPGMEKP